MSKLQKLAGVCAVLAIIVGVVTLLPIQLQAQTTNGSILGTVTDASGAAVSGATVTVVNLGTNETRAIKSDAAGNYNAANLVPANYKITVEAANFKRQVRQPIPVAVGATVRVDAALQVGAATETIEVTTQAPLLQTDSGGMTNQVEGKTVQEMPLNGRNTMNLLALSPGVVAQGSTAGGLGQNQGQGHTMLSGFGNYQIGGALAGQNAAYIDGAAANVISAGLASNVVALVMTQDAVQEFNVASTAVSAEFGRYAGGVINMASKSGTNNLHGSVYEYFRNAAVNANDWWNKRIQAINSQKNKPLQWNQNQYGVTLGGPVLKDKLFYNFTWEGFRSTTANPNTSNMPDTNMQAGSVSGNILSAVTPYCSTASYSATTGLTTIPSTCWDSMAAVIKTYYPAPNVSGVAVGKNNYYNAPSTPDSQNQYNARVDYALGNNQRIFARYTYWGLVDAPQSMLNDYNGWKTAKSGSSNWTQQAVLGDTYTFSSATILDVRLSWLRDLSFSSKPESLGQTYEKFSGTYLANSSNIALLTGKVLPVASFSGGKKSYSIYGVNVSNGGSWSTNYAISASLMHIVGNHSLKFGTELRQMQVQYTLGGNAGSLAFNGNVTGDEWVDFLLGRVFGNSTSLTVQVPAKDYTRYAAFYVTDTWQATRRLTVNAGLRWEMPGGLYTAKDMNSVLLPGTTDSSGAGATIALVNSPQYAPRTAFDVKHDMFAPRLGLAYRLNDKTSIRGGYGLSYLAIDTGTADFSQTNPVNSAPTTCTTGTMYNCFTILSPPLRTGLTTGKSIITQMNYYNNTSGNISLAVPHQRVPYAQQWNLAIGHEFKGSTMLEISYAGSKSNFLPYNGGFQLNELPAVYDSTGKITGSTYTGFSLSDTSVNRCGTFNGSNLSAGQCLRPYPNLGSVKNGLQYHGSVLYHGLIMKGEKRFGTGGTLMGNFTWSKQIGDTDTSMSFLETATTATGFGTAGSIQNYYNVNSKTERAALSYDVPYRAVITYIINLPFGEGQKWANNGNAVVSHIVSGWGLSGITTFQHGFHVPVSTSGSWALKNSFGAGTIRPNFTAGCSKASTYSGNARIAGWFNTSCFTTPGSYGYGNEPRVDRSIFQQGTDNFDFTALKTTKVTEKTDLQFRAEFFNLFNRKQFSPPDAAYASSTFGQVLSTNGHQPRLIQFSLRVNF